MAYETYNIYTIWYDITQGQGPVPGCNDVATPRSWSKAKVKKEFVDGMKHDGSVMITKTKHNPGDTILVLRDGSEL